MYLLLNSSDALPIFLSYLLFFRLDTIPVQLQTRGLLSPHAWSTSLEAGVGSGFVSSVVLTAKMDAVKGCECKQL